MPMSDPPSAPPPPTPEPDGTGKMKFSPPVIVVLLTLFVGVLVFVAFTVAPPVLWFLAVVPILSGALHAAGHPPGVKVGRFFKAFFITTGIELVLGVVVYGVCVAIVSSQIGG